MPYLPASIKKTNTGSSKLLPKILLCLFLVSFQAVCQDRENIRVLPVTGYNVEEGLGQSTVYQVLQDSRGLIWVASGDGLQYFDGSGFRSFYPGEDLSASSSGNLVNGMIEVVPGQMVLSTVSSVLGFSSSSGSFNLTREMTQQYPLLLSGLFLDKPLCWINSTGLCLVGEHGLEPVHLSFKDGNILPSGFNPVKGVKTGSGNFMMVSENGFLEIIPGDKVKGLNWDAKWIPAASPGNNAACDNNGKLYLLSDGIIYSRDENGMKDEIFNTGIKEAPYFFIDKGNNFWLSDYVHRQVYRISNRKQECIQFITREGKYADTINAAVRSFFEDNNGNLWFGTDGNGLLYYSPGQLYFDMNRTGFTRCLAYFNGEIWAGTFKNGLWRLPIGLGSKIRVNPAVLNDKIYFFDLATDISGRLWAATNLGVFVLGRDGSVVFHQPLNTSSAKFITIPGEKLFLSTYDELYTCNTGSAPGLDFIRKQTQIRDFTGFNGRYWAGNHFGLFVNDLGAGIVESLNFNDDHRLTTLPVYCIRPIDNLIWAGTEHGVALFSSQGEKIPVPQYLRELDHETVYSLIPDSLDRVWFTSNKGAGCIRPGRERIIRFDLRNKLQSSEFNFNAALDIGNNRVFWGGINGINGINTSDFRIKEIDPEVSLISLNVSDSLYSKGIPPEHPGIRIHWGAPHISGKVFTPEYPPSGTPGFSFYLEGYQDSWSKSSASPAFSYRNLPPGEYHLWAKCIDAYQNEGKAKCLLDIIIKPPFWKTWWFITLAALVFVTAITIALLGFQKARYRNMLKELEQRNAIDRERLRISQDMHDEIGASLTQVTILSEIMKKQENKGEMVKLADKISSISGSLVDELSEIIWAMNPKNDNLSSFTSYLRRYASEYLSNAAIDAEIHFPDECPSVLMTSEQRRNIFLVVKEALHNIVKHSAADRVIVTLNWSDNLIAVRIIDNGKGFETEKCSSSGNGLTGMRNRIVAIGGTYAMASVPGNGTQVDFSVRI
jgi:signal transduction histidine kinase/ligand-binding sensor domain-containing protein